MTSYTHQLVAHRLNLLVRHIGHVRDNCLQLSQYFFDNDEPDLAVEIVARGLCHDQSKFAGEEWLYLHAEVKESHPHYFKSALKRHQSTNDHHPEYWPESIKGMTRAALAEWCCDVLARAQEFGTDVWEWVLEVACPRYGITQDSPSFKQVQEFMGVLLERKFS